MIIILAATSAAKDHRDPGNEAGVHACAQGDGKLSTGCVAADVHKLSPGYSHHEVQIRWDGTRHESQSPLNFQ